MHFTCIYPEAPGAAQVCPVCTRMQTSEEDVYPYMMEVGAPARRPKPPSLGPQIGVDELPLRLKFPVGRRATDAEARETGFKDAQDWYARTSVAFRSGQT